MKILFTLTLSVALLSACEPSGTAKAEMEKFSGTPTPTFAPIVTATPVDPSNIVQVDTSLDGDTLSENGYQQKTTLKCDKYNNVRINGDANLVTITGACRQIAINGDGNQVAADTSVEFVFNGTGNRVTYSHFPNGKRPTVIDNVAGNSVEQVPAVRQNNQSTISKVK